MWNFVREPRINQLVQFKLRLVQILLNGFRLAAFARQGNFSAVRISYQPRAVRLLEMYSLVKLLGEYSRPRRRKVQFFKRKLLQSRRRQCFLDRQSFLRERLRD